MELKITNGNFEKEVLESNMPVLVDFYADWCGPCKMMAPLIAQVAESYEGRCKVGKCNIDENMELAQRYQVMSIPTIILFQNGEAKATSIGAVSKGKIEEMINAAL